MKIKRLYLILAIAVVVYYGCAASKDNAAIKEMTGQIVVVGNEPFTNVAIQVNPSTNYILDCSGEIRATLLDNQGKWVKIFYNKIDNSNNINTIEVQKAEILTRK